MSVHDALEPVFTMGRRTQSKALGIRTDVVFVAAFPTAHSLA